MSLGPTPATALLDKLRAGDIAAFEQLFHAEYAHLCTFVDRLVESEAVAEDLVQSVFLRLWTSRTQLESVESIRAYLYRAARNASLDYLKHQRVERRWAETTLAEEVSDQPDDADDLVRVEQANSLHEAIAGLTPGMREIVTLRWLRGMKHSEISEVLGISVKGVEIQVTRALRALRRHLDGQRGQS
jgi:RNA polymerase sigma-70 factor (ECF subfamily)